MFAVWKFKEKWSATKLYAAHGEVACDRELRVCSQDNRCVWVCGTMYRYETVFDEKQSVLDED
jgi:hypothetical protein